MHLAHKHICPLSSASITYILELSAAVDSPGTREIKKKRKRERERQIDASVSDLENNLTVIKNRNSHKHRRIKRT